MDESSKPKIQLESKNETTYKNLWTNITSVIKFRMEKSCVGFQWKEIIISNNFLIFFWVEKVIDSSFTMWFATIKWILKCFCFHDFICFLFDFIQKVFSTICEWECGTFYIETGNSRPILLCTWLIHFFWIERRLLHNCF